MLRLSTQNSGGMLAWRRSVRMMSLVVRMALLALPFCGEVWGKERRREMPFSERKERRQILRNSPPLSHWIHWMQR